jgi:serine/threonine-protein kinase
VTHTDLIGRTLGEYAVAELLGSGGMASVYRGLDLHLQRPVAIKVLGPQAAAIPGYADRFRQEARLVASLRHPNIVQIYTFGELHGLTYMVQELLPGPTLDAQIADAARRGAPLAPPVVISIVAQLAAALDAAHAAGIIHRDVKPANALWNADGALVLTDFGIAKDTVGAVEQTQAGLVMGTPAYMSPEQAQGRPLTPASDIYSLGVVIYELLAGRVPFADDSPIAVALAHVQAAPPPLAALRPGLPSAVEPVVQRALAKDPAARFASAGALAEALRRAWDVPQAGPIHELQTQAWTPPVPATRAAPAVVAPRPAPSAPSFGGPPAPVAHAPPAARRPSLLPILGGLLLLVFLAGAVLALRGDDGDAAAPGAPAAEAAPTAPPASDASAAPASPPAPPADTPPSSGPTGELRDLLASAAADGGAGPSAGNFVALADAAGQAIERGDGPGAVARLTELQQQLLAEARAGAVDPDLLRRALAGIQSVADAHGLTLPLSVGG